ncbi:unnamed protein product [[Actinomadura] parvosata subsp. kistnae]|nr:unnamed protein product [Actinomadura parvosata subsp. kistnae]
MSPGRACRRVPSRSIGCRAARSGRPARLRQAGRHLKDLVPSQNGDEGTYGSAGRIAGATQARGRRSVGRAGREGGT